MTLPYRLVSGYHAWSALASPANRRRGDGSQGGRRGNHERASTCPGKNRSSRAAPAAGATHDLLAQVLGLWVPANGWPPRPWHKVQANWKQAMKEMVPWT